MTYSGCRAALAIAARRPLGAPSFAPAVHGSGVAHDSHGSALRYVVVAVIHRILNTKKATPFGVAFFVFRSLTNGNAVWTAAGSPKGEGQRPQSP